jgi:hypothetical protein
MGSPSLPGLDRLLEVTHKHRFPMRALPPGSTPHRAGELLAGMPVDPLLAAACERLGGLVLGADIHVLMRCDDKMDGILEENKQWQGCFPHDSWPDHFQGLMIFGGEMLYRYATVPALASPEGLQPVVFLDPYEAIYALPVASDMNRFFETCSRYVEIMAEDPEYQARGVSIIGFPWGTPELIAKDRSLVEMIKEGRFERLMYERDKTGWRDERGVADAQKWLSQVLQ